MSNSQAAVFTGQDKPLEIWEFPQSDPEEGAVVVHMEMAAICGTDAHAIHHPDTPAPTIFGHENIGTIAANRLGRNTDALGQPLKEGDRVTFRASPCGHCFNCTIGEFCMSVRQPGFTPSNESPYLYGGFGQQVHLPPDPWLLRIPDDLSNERALLSVVGTHTLLNGYERIGGLNLGDTVVIQGSGPMGIGGLLQAKLLGAGRVIVIGAPTGRLDLATRLGADETISINRLTTADERVEAVMDLTGGRGADVVVECSGARGATQEGLRMVRFGGKYLLVGPWTDYGTQDINPTLITKKALRVSGVVASEPRHIVRSMEALRSMVDVPVEDLVTHQFPLAQVNEAFGVHESLEAMVAVILPNA
jgi:threonine dehydrogenase-like Zn-dependent dehydrogenase